MNMQVSPNKELFAHMSYCSITVTCVLTIPEFCCMQIWFCFPLQLVITHKYIHVYFYIAVILFVPVLSIKTFLNLS